MTDATMALSTLLEKSPDADFLREMIGFAAERLMELEVPGLTGAAHWASFADALAAQFTSFVMDRRGRGASGDAVTHSLAHERDDVLALLAEAGPASLLCRPFFRRCVRPGSRVGAPTAKTHSL